MHKPKALVISHSNIAEDPRVLRHISVISERFEVHTVGYGERPVTSEKHFRVPDDVRFLPRSFSQLINMQVGRSITVSKSSDFTKSIVNLVQPENINYELIQINDVHALAAGFELRKDAKVWVDMHEYAPLEGEHDWRWMVAFKPYVSELCDNYLKQADFVSTVSGGIARRYSREIGLPVSVIRNSHPFVAPPMIEVTKKSHRLNFVHVGAALPARKLEIMIEAFRDLDQMACLDLLLSPTSKKYYEKLIKLAASTENVNVLDPVPNSEVVTSLTKYDCGIIAIPPTSFNYQNGLPNKLFQYIQARIPIVTGPLPEIAEIVNSQKIGWVADGFAAGDFSKLIEKISSDDFADKSSRCEMAAIDLSSESDDSIRLQLVTQCALS